MRSLSVVTTLVLVSQATPAVPPMAAPGYPWALIDQNKNVTVFLYLFTRDDCEPCEGAKTFVNALTKRHPWLSVKVFNTTGNEKNTKLYNQMWNVFYREAPGFPLFIYCHTSHNAYEDNATTNGRIEAALKILYNAARKQR
jgi:hypothetical protein